MVVVLNLVICYQQQKGLDLVRVVSSSDLVKQLWVGRTGADQWSVDIMGIIIRQMRPSRHRRGAGGCNHGQHSVTVRMSAHLQTQLS